MFSKPVPKPIVPGFYSHPPQLLPLSEPEENEAERAQQRVLHDIVAELERRTDRELKFYRRSAMLRRIRRRMQLHHIETLRDYLLLLRRRPEEATELCNDLLLTVSEFFRDPEVFDLLEKAVLPRLLAIKSDPHAKLRLWSVGCSTGEEAYSLAMLLLEQVQPRAAAPQMQVFASDLSEEMLHRAREGLYPHEVATTVSNERLKRFFTEEGGHYRVAQSVRSPLQSGAASGCGTGTSAHPGTWQTR